MHVPHRRPVYTPEAQEAVRLVLERGTAGEGMETDLFERAMASLVGRKYAVAVSSGTAALELAVGAYVETTSKVIIPTYGCSSLHVAAVNAGATVYFGDVGVDGLMKEEEFDDRRAPCAVVLVHMFGKRGYFPDTTLPLIEDFAQAVGLPGVGRRGVFSVCSFYATKLLNAGVGGMVFTDDVSAYFKLIRMRDIPKTVLGSPGEGEYHRYKMPNICAAIGLAHLQSLPWVLAERNRIANFYLNSFAGDTIVPLHKIEDESAFSSFIVLVAQRDTVRQALLARGIHCGVGVLTPLLRTDMSSWLCEHTLSIPLWPGMNEEMAGYVVDNIQLATRGRPVRMPEE